MTISLPALRSFAAVARLGKFSVAARELHLTQPALSRHVRLIEAQLGQPVFERLPGGTRLTEAGKVFCGFVETCLSSLHDGLEAVDAMRGGETARIRLGLAGTLCNDIFLGVLRDFKARNPGIEVSLQMLVNSQVSEAVLRGDAHLGIQYREDRHPRLRQDVLGKETVVVVCAPQHPMANARTVHPGDLAAETWIGTPIALSDQEAEYRHYLARFGLVGNNIMIAQSYAIRNRLVEANLGIGIAVKSVVRKELASGSLRAIHIPAMRGGTAIMLVRRKQGYLSASALSFAELLKRAFSAPKNAD